MIKPLSRILFQGDSITDAGRNREDAGNLGYGYVVMVAGNLMERYAGQSISVCNRGISGNRVVDLYARWKIDAINLKPDIISILIGVNDTWHEFACQNGVEVERYEMVYRQLLDYTLKNLPAVQLVLCEPFVVPCGVVTSEWIKEIDQRRQVVRTLAKEYKTLFVPFQELFNDCLKKAPAEYWCADGVHPTSAGHHAMAQAWIKAVEAA